MKDFLLELNELKRQIGNIHYFDFNLELPQQTNYKLSDTQLLKNIEDYLKALDIIRNKNVDLYDLRHSVNSTDYNNTRIDMYSLTQEEYDLLKEVLL